MHSGRQRASLALIGMSTFASALCAPAEAQGARAESLTPVLRLEYTTGVPDARGDGAAMRGVGLDALVSAGVRGSLGPLGFQLAPLITANENGAFDTRPGGDPARHPLSSPFYFGDVSADLPSRPGTGRFSRAFFGESGVWWTGPRAMLAIATTTPRWGPRTGDDDLTSLIVGRLGPGEGLVLGHSAPGVPRLELATSRRAANGAFRARWLGGMAVESDWFDDDASNDHRLLTGVRLEYARGASSPGASAFALGVARTVMNAAGRGTLEAAFQPLWRASTDESMELLSVDALYAHAAAGTTGWVELVRQSPIGSASDFFKAPTEGIAYRIGVRQRLVEGPRAAWHASLEIVDLDQSSSRAGAPSTDLYTSAVVVHGWTHLGQPLGSGIGPGGQRQILALDRIGTTWRLGAFAERVRWNDDAMYREAAPASDRHDVTLQLGLRAAREIGGYDVAAFLSGGQRIDYLFQGPSVMPDARGVDVGVMRMGLTLTRAGGAPRIVGVLPEP